MYNERSHHYNPILNLKAAADSHGRYCVSCNIDYQIDKSHRCTKKCLRCYVIPTWISLNAKRVIIRSLETTVSSVIVLKDLMMKKFSQVFANQLKFATIADDA